MIDVIVDQRFLGRDDRLLHGLKLLGDVDAWSAGLDHLDNTAQMTARAVETLDDSGMAFMAMVGHGARFIPFLATFTYPPGEDSSSVQSYPPRGMFKTSKALRLALRSG